MKTTKRTKITVQQHEVWVVRRARKTVTTRCAACKAEVEMVTAEQAATLARVSTRTIYRQVESGQLHFTETTDGRLFICLNSLTA